MKILIQHSIGHRIIATLLLVMAFMSVMCGSAFAMESTEAEYTPEVIGTSEDEDGILLSDSVMPASTGTLFTMTATKVTSLLTTHGVNGKSFTGGAMDGLAGEGLEIAGKVTSSLGTGSNYTIKVGACYYKSSTDTYVSAAWSYFNSGTSSSCWFQKVNVFGNSTTYYGHITNHLGSGYVYGSLTYSVTTGY